ncbi:UDP-N-acetyl-D-mannosamine dehydrogenase [Carboxylicivirga sp. M1479]|uniref:UDP-N-acetyl-D-mannosamine dehydrogenase n=1 Tax=Carboxylicivirga sp. M1479 TaxID=2594476 RepID=UPI001178C3F4|nr:UDP-N-acetyl-D-mannosamine dehydrogenase [Carboxylicivirga sp. M1479]TRX70569.1 UDP-N-acetyl-D-mannosamine dehydrogenase [Carboxylicivirga sp. M1479]
MQTPKVSIIGMGYIGLPTAALIANKQIEVNGYDINPHVIEIINKGEIHIIEPGLQEMVKKGVKEGFLKASSQLQEADVYLIVVPTPFKGNNEPDISFVEAATRNVLPLLKEGDLYIIESTSPVMTTEKMGQLIASERPELVGKIHIAYCPERVLPGKALEEMVVNDRAIGGVDDKATQKACEFYSLFVNGELHRTNARTAEMCKLVENSSRDVQIAFANELSIICDKASINVWELIELANKHPRVNILQPGCGVGGHCIAVDPWFIVSDYPEQAHVIRQAREINDYKADWCVEKTLKTALVFEVKHGRQPVIACMGLAFKPNIDDLRESPAKYIASKIVAEARGEVLVVEPHIHEHASFSLTAQEDAIEKADIIVWLVRHTDFLDNKTGKLELDFCGVRK